jgi:zinc protease
LQVLADIIGGGPGSRLYRGLVLKDGIALTAGADYAPAAVGLSTFAVYATPKPGVVVADLEKAIDAELRRVAESGADADEVTRSRRRLQASLIYSQDSLAGPANTVGVALSVGQSLDDVAAWADRIGAVTPEAVQAAARAVLIERNSVTGILLPERTS